MGISGISFGGATYNYYGRIQGPNEQLAGYGQSTDPVSRIPGLDDERPAAVYERGIAKADDEGAAYDKDKVKKPGYRSSPEECQTCKERKYQDGSNEMVSFKTPGHIDPGNAASVVLGHEHEHVANAYAKANRDNGKVENVSVRLKTAICPECGRTYIAGGVTNTQIKYYNEDNPYQQNLKKSDADNKYRGMNVDFAA